MYSYVIGRIFKKDFIDRGDILKVRKAFHNLPYPGREIYTTRYPELDFASEKIGEMEVEWVSGTDRIDAPVIIYLHGGGYMMGNINTHRIVTTRIARYAKAHVLALDYRLAPEHPFPAALEDATGAYNWLMRRKPRSRIFISGDSAGGGLALATLIALRDAGSPMPAGAICLSPWTDLAITGLSIIENRKKDKIVGGAPMSHWAKTYLNGVSPKDPLASPLYAELYGLPPILLQASSAEVLRDDTIRFAEKAKRSGVDVEMKLWRGLQHVWQAFPSRGKEVDQAFSNIADFIHSAAEQKAS